MSLNWYFFVPLKHMHSLKILTLWDMLNLRKMLDEEVFGFKSATVLTLVFILFVGNNRRWLHPGGRLHIRIRRVI